VGSEWGVTGERVCAFTISDRGMSSRPFIRRELFRLRTNVFPLNYSAAHNKYDDRQCFVRLNVKSTKHRPATLRPVFTITMNAIAPLHDVAGQQFPFFLPRVQSVTVGRLERWPRDRRDVGYVANSALESQRSCVVRWK